QLISQGADIIMPVAGPVGLGAAAAAKEAEDVKLVWVDSDGYESTEYGDIILTSVVKQIANAVEDTVEEGMNDEFTSEPYVGTLENEGGGLAPYHDFDDEVPDEAKDKVDELKQQIIDGSLPVESESTPNYAHKSSCRSESFGPAVFEFVRRTGSSETRASRDDQGVRVVRGQRPHRSHHRIG